MPILKSSIILLCIVLLPLLSLANPYPDPNQVPRDEDYPSLVHRGNHFVPIGREQALGTDVLRVNLQLDATTHVFSLQSLTREPSGTPGLVARSAKADPLGSYHGILKDHVTGKEIALDSVGTGVEYQRLVRAVSFRFPFPQSATDFELVAENARTGKMESVLTFPIDPSHVLTNPVLSGLEVRTLKVSTAASKLILTIYAEGYLESRRDIFWHDAQHVVDSLVGENFPGVDAMEFHAVFAASAVALGSPRDLGMPVPSYNTFLGLFYPYWENFGRWYNVVYPTREEKFRTALGQVAYDYPVIVADDSNYWGIGNYHAFTAVPNAGGSFTYLLLHEFGHFFGLNEEYEGGGPTELQFAPEIVEPWSQNITFLASTSRDDLKWGSFVLASTPLPTPRSSWTNHPPLFGAYAGGYADSDRVHSHKPGFSCVMERAPHFCPIYRKAISEVIAHDTAR